jgi:hypothetical protein
MQRQVQVVIALVLLCIASKPADSYMLMFIGCALCTRRTGTCSVVTSCSDRPKMQAVATSSSADHATARAIPTNALGPRMVGAAGRVLQQVRALHAGECSKSCNCQPSCQSALASRSRCSEQLSHSKGWARATQNTLLHTNIWHDHCAAFWWPVCLAAGNSAQGPINALKNGIVNFEADGNGKREAGNGGAGNKSGCKAWNAVTKGGLDRAIGDITIPISDDPPSGSLPRNCPGVVGQWNP